MKKKIEVHHEKPMLRNKRFYIPKEEIVRDYKDRHTITPMDIICKCDRVDDDDEYE